MQIKKAYEEFGKLLKRLMEGEAIVYVSDFLNSSMIKYDKVSIIDKRIRYKVNIVTKIFRLLFYYNIFNFGIFVGRLQLIRDVHISFIKYIESILEESSNTVAAYWSNVLKTIEPTVLQIFHHIEAVFVSAFKQVIRKCLKRI